MYFSSFVDYVNSTVSQHTSLHRPWIFEEANEPTHDHQSHSTEHEGPNRTPNPELRILVLRFRGHRLLSRCAFSSRCGSI